MLDGDTMIEEAEERKSEFVIDLAKMEIYFDIEEKIVLLSFVDFEGNEHGAICTPEEAITLGNGMVEAAQFAVGEKIKGVSDGVN